MIIYPHKDHRTFVFIKMLVTSGRSCWLPVRSRAGEDSSQGLGFHALLYCTPLNEESICGVHFLKAFYLVVRESISSSASHFKSSKVRCANSFRLPRIFVFRNPAQKSELEKLLRSLGNCVCQGFSACGYLWHFVFGYVLGVLRILPWQCCDGWG